MTPAVERGAPAQSVKCIIRPSRLGSLRDIVAKLLLLHGPNLNMLGTRQPEIYGAETLNDIDERLRRQAEAAGHTLTTLQSNAEHELVQAVQQAQAQGVSYIVLNPAAFTHTSVALRDALLGVDIPFVEVQLANVHAREAFRRHSYFSDIAAGVISGFGARSYAYALAAAIDALR